MNTKRRHTGPSVATVELVRARSKGLCERCGDVATQTHHRVPRGLGGTRDPRINLPGNLLNVCLDCHGYIEQHRGEALEAGWIVSRYRDPADVPVLVDRQSQWVRLTHDGRYELEMAPAPDPLASLTRGEH